MPTRCGAPAAARRSPLRISFAAPRSKIPRGGRRGRAADRRLHPGSAAVRRDRRRTGQPTSATSSISARPQAGRQDAAAAGPKMAALIAAAAEPAPEIPFVSLTSEGVILIYGRDEQAIEAARAAQGSSRRHGADHAAGRRRAAARHRISGGEGHDPRRQGPSRRVRADGRRLCQPAPSSRGALASGRPATARSRAATSCSISRAARRCFPRADLRDGYLRADPGDRPRCSKRC